MRDKSPLTPDAELYGRIMYEYDATYGKYVYYFAIVSNIGTTYPETIFQNQNTKPFTMDMKFSELKFIKNYTNGSRIKTECGSGEEAYIRYDNGLVKTSLSPTDNQSYYQSYTVLK